MLKILRRIVQEVSSTPRFDTALQILVERVRDAIATQACTVFLIDKSQHEYVLLATDGLNPACVGHVRLKMNQGLVGLVGQRGEPINLDNAPGHPNFYHAIEIGEERYKAFLGVPIIHHRCLLGVLVVQQEECRRFDEAEEAFLVTMSSQLGGVIAHAEATGTITQLLQQKNFSTKLPTNLILYGIASSPGVAIGNAVIVYPSADLAALYDRKVDDLDVEYANIKKAFSAVRTDISNLGKRLTNLPNGERALFDAYLKILDSDSLEAEIIAEIRNNNWAQGALRHVINRHVQQFEAMDDDYLRERAADLRELGQRILIYLQSNQRFAPVYPEQTILVGEEITASALAEVPEGQLVGIAAMRGSSNSHVAILARALGIPVVLGIENLPFTQLAGQELIIDGSQGQVHITPSPELRNQYLNLINEQHAYNAGLEKLRSLPAQTLDGYSIALWINMGLAADAALSLISGAEGVGLYRTEIPFMSRDRFPAEEEQYITYRQLLSTFAPRPVIMRTLDVGGDKMLPYFPVREDNPFLGWRGIRITLDHPEIFLVQIRAMLRANCGFNNLRIMLPMVTNISEADDALRLIQQAYHELQTEAGAENVTMPPIGVMLEVPAAIYQTHALAQRVDFLSVGSNDLTQYLLAVDRNNVRVATLYDALHPAVLHALLQAVKAAHAVNKPISICGEMASNPAIALLLLAMGFDALSMSSVALPRIKWIIRNFTLKQAQELLAEILTMDNATAIRHHLEQALKKAGIKI